MVQGVCAEVGVGAVIGRARRYVGASFEGSVHHLSTRPRRSYTAVYMAQVQKPRAPQGVLGSATGRGIHAH